MTADRASVLRAAARRRHDDARRRAVEALRMLSTTSGPVSFAAVAEAAGVSRAWLYRQADLRPAIDTLRQNPSRAARPTRPAAERATAESLGQQLAALRALEAELRAENTRLREALARRLGQERAGAPR
jgi:hypothetical protein